MNIGISLNLPPNLGHHSKVLTMGDCTKEEIKEYYNGRFLNDVPKDLQKNLSFDHIHDCFGSKLAYWSDYLTEYTNTQGFQTRPLPLPSTSDSILMVSPSINCFLTSIYSPPITSLTCFIPPIVPRSIPRFSLAQRRILRVIRNTLVLGPRIL
jgi:hypothetical protein